MNIDRIRRDKQQLDQTYDARWADIDGVGILLLNFPFPERWTPQTAPVLIRFPTGYPRIQPAMYIHEDMEYDGKVTHRHSCTIDGWDRWCTHPLTWTREHDIEDNFLKLMSISLTQPADPDPFTIRNARDSDLDQAHDAPRNQ